MARRLDVAFARFDAAELRFCRYLNRSSRSSLVRESFRTVSWLGDGWLWYALLLVLPLLYGGEGLRASLHMTATAGLGLTLYKLIKSRAVRERPYITHSAIECASAPLDRYSFPSGHTLHAVCFTLILTSYFPEWTAALAAVTLLIALSRVILGLHYPTDVAAGAALGGALGFGSLLLAQQSPL
jgi:undecaprenyl-diphosphatase